jgi:hypothetical protein
MLTKRTDLLRVLVEVRVWEQASWFAGVWSVQVQELQALPQAQELARRLELVSPEVWLSQALESQVQLVLELRSVCGWILREASMESSASVECRRPVRDGRWSSRRRSGCPDY